MKTIIRTAAMAALLIIASCGKDSADETAQQQQQEAENLEQTPLEANNVSDNVVIEGGTKNEGVPPTPNEAIDFNSSGTSTMALLNEGFEVSLSSDAAIVGAYIQFKSNDGTAADSYYDINIDANGADNKSNKSSKLVSKKSSSSAKEDETTKLDVDFSSAIEPGTFCYEICVYDGEGNISAPQEVCVTVESWGGNAAIVATWNLTKEVETWQGNTVTVVPGQEDCSEETVYECDEGGQFTASYVCYISDFATLVFNADGTYEFNSKDTERYLKGDESKASCEATFLNEEDIYNSKGNWAYDQGEKQLVLVEYEYTETYEGETESVTFEPGKGELLYEGTIILEGNSLVIKVDDTDELKYDVHFEK